MRRGRPGEKKPGVIDEDRAFFIQRMDGVQLLQEGALRFLPRSGCRAGAAPMGVEPVEHGFVFQPGPEGLQDLRGISQQEFHDGIAGGFFPRGAVEFRGEFHGVYFFEERPRLRDARPLVSAGLDKGIQREDRLQCADHVLVDGKINSSHVR